MRHFLLCIALLSSDAAFAENSDTNIHVEYVTSTYRVRPKPGPKTATTKFDIVLHANGKVDDSLVVQGPHPRKFGSKDRKLGENRASLVQYHILNESTILRTFDDGVLAGSMKIELNKNKGCEATVTFTLNPTLKEYEDYSTELGTKAFYRDLKVLRTKCSIT
jgi:hypothetical protein